MSHLSLSTRRAFTLERFVRSFKDEFGNTTNVLEQQDAQEFFEKTCDRLDEAMKTQGNITLFKSTLGVRVASALICLDDPSQERREDAGTVEWALKLELTHGGGTLQQSLDDFVSGEILSDFRWQDKGPSLRTMKKTYVTSLADTLTIQLKRFQLNWETQLTEKINDRLEFPMDLDMFSYTKEGLDYAERATNTSETSTLSASKYSVEGRPEDYYKYRLVGILVHSGASLNAGHYYSHILSRFPGQTQGRWFTFNDTSVMPFDTRELADQTFGGTIKQTIVNPETKALQEVESVVTHSAYMLFYERVKHFEDDLTPPPSAAVSPLVEAEVLRENLEHLVACRWFDPSLLSFLSARCSPSAPAPQFPVVDEMDKKRKQNELLGVRPDDYFGKVVKTRIPTETILIMVFKSFLTGQAIVARSANSSAIYPGLVDAVRKALDENLAAHLLSMLTRRDLELLLFECSDIRTRISFSGLLGALCRTAPRADAESFLASILLSPAMLDLALAHAENSYWFAVRHVLDLSDVLALKAFRLGIVPELLNAALGSDSPAFEYSRAAATSLVPHIKRSSGSPPPPPPSGNYARNAWDNAIVAAISATCSALDALPRPDEPDADEALSGADEASMRCANDMTAWIKCIGSITLQETTEKIYSILFQGMLRGYESEASIAVKLAKFASTASLDSVPRYYDVVYLISVDSPQAAVTFFLGEDDEAQIGFLRRVVANRSSLFAFACVTSFVERLEDFPRMKAPGVREKWVANVDSFLRDDNLTGTLEPRDINRVLTVLETLAHLYDGSGGHAASPADCDTASTITQPANGWHSDDDDDDLYGTQPNGEAEDV